MNNRIIMLNVLVIPLRPHTNYPDIRQGEWTFSKSEGCNVAEFVDELDTLTSEHKILSETIDYVFSSSPSGLGCIDLVHHVIKNQIR